MTAVPAPPLSFSLFSSPPSFLGWWVLVGSASKGMVANNSAFES
eukprot:CAMPEP_0198259228 /NCGR_PEP_ID=MMETSP1447-20131203/8486_1 /TAXON_ID=420782 /ORGANISM="Chaetoceros dichaeta, Strain CCMP1751" /LENGTH=43 /DNA_ID= /DNA_START= /DNA_END= /DNA_ORIENTATION=